MFTRPNGSKELDQQHFLDLGVQIVKEIGFVRGPHDAPPKAGLMPSFYLAVAGVRRADAQRPDRLLERFGPRVEYLEVPHDLANTRPLVDEVESVDVNDKAGGQRHRLAAVYHWSDRTVERPADKLKASNVRGH